MEQLPGSADCVIIGAGHNGLVAAAYLARAGRSVLVLERSDHVGGAAISKEVFPGVAARLSKYAYLVSLLPESIRSDLGIELELVRRRVSSYTPDPHDPAQGLAIPVGDAQRLRAEFARVVGDPAEADRWMSFYERTEQMAKALFPTLTQPLMGEADARAALGEATWRDFIERPLGEVIEASLTSDIARGVVLTDGLIGTFADSHDPSLRQNVCFLYHVIGNGTGDWDVPIGGMGHLTQQLADRAREWGARIITHAEVTGISDSADSLNVSYRLGSGETRAVSATYVVANCAPAVLDELRGRTPRTPVGDDAGAQIKINMLLTHLPRLRDESVAPEDAFCGTFHINENYSQLNAAVARARSGSLPAPFPAEIYCHSLSDPSILGEELREAGVQTLTMFVLHTPDDLFRGDSAPTRHDILAAAFATLNSVLAEPIEGCLYRDATGEPCIEVNTTVDLAADLHIPGGNIFHTPLDWPWALTDEEVGTWGVETDDPRIVMGGSGARRGGGVSGIPGHNAARYLLER